MKIHRDQVYEICKIVAPKFNFAPLLILALSMQEAEKDKTNPALFLADYARLEQAFYRKYVVKMDFAAQPQPYRDTYGNNPMHFAAVPDCINRWCVEPTKQIETACEWLDRKRKAVGNDPHKFLLAWNGGSNPNYDDEVLQKQDMATKLYGVAA